MRRLWIALFVLMGCQGTRPTDLGLTDGQLKACPESPNCVSTFADPADKEHYITPITISVDAKTAMAAIQKAINNFERSSVIELKDEYTRAEFKTFVGWVDDVEFYIDTTNQLIHFRSASRIGSSDFGTNRERMERLRTDILSQLQ